MTPPDTTPRHTRQAIDTMLTYVLGAAAQQPPVDRDLPLLTQPELADVAVNHVSFDSPHGVTGARLYRVPGASTDAALVWVHGGGFLSGNLDVPEAHWVGLALAHAGIPVLSIDYRKALSGVHYPLPSDDVLAGWTWAVEHAALLGVSPEQLHIGGASAGGNLTAGVTKRLLDGAGPIPASLLLAYPLVHSVMPPWKDPRIQRELEQTGATLLPDDFAEILMINYAGGEIGLSDPYAVPAVGSVDPAHPPTFVLHGEWDTLRRSSEAYAEQLAEAGVEVREETEPRALHGSLGRFDEDGPSGIARMVRWLRH